MKIQYCSDLHLEFAANSKFLKKHPIVPKGEILILAGDIVPFIEIDLYQDFFDYLADNFTCTYWLPGNHEYYYFDAANRSGKLHEKIRSNVFLVNNEVIQLDGISIICSTLWSMISPQYFLPVQKRMSDFHTIKYNGQAFTAENFNQLHLDCKHFLINALSNDQGNKTIVATHHVPSFLNYPTKYKGDILSEAFAVELHDFIEAANIDYWIYGHHHFNTPTFDIGKTKMLTNQLGYIKYKENMHFNGEAIIEI